MFSGNKVYYVAIFQFNVATWILEDRYFFFLIIRVENFITSFGIYLYIEKIKFIRFHRYFANIFLQLYIS